MDAKSADNWKRGKGFFMRVIDAAATKLKNLLLATDFSRVSEAALLYAESIARRYGSQVVATHVLSPGETALVPPEAWGSCQQALEEAACREMEELDQRLRDLPHRVELRYGLVGDIIADLIETCDIDLLVMGTHGHGGLGRLLMGSTAEAIFRQARCPVLTIGPHVVSKHEADFNEIVCAIDFSSASLAGLPYALSLAQDYQAQLTLLHVVTEPSTPPEGVEAITFDRIRDLRSLASSERELWRRPECDVKFGNAADGILEAARERNADLIVLGVKAATGHIGAATHLATATAHSVVALATCPALSVRR
jgi:nucleotide-binding universal stress UspA family protein